MITQVDDAAEGIALFEGICDLLTIGASLETEVSHGQGKKASIIKIEAIPLH